MATTKVSLKLLVDTKAKKVLFAESGKDFVDFLFKILSLPAATIVKLLKDANKEMSIGCLGNIYESVQKLDNDYIQPNQNKETLLKPQSLTKFPSLPLLSMNNTTTSRKFYKCVGGCTGYVAEDSRADCPYCRRKMSTELSYVAPPAGEGTGLGLGFVKGMVTYMVMDDLTVKPISSISCIALFNKYGVKEVGDLEERVVDLGVEEVVNDSDLDSDSDSDFDSSIEEEDSFEMEVDATESNTKLNQNDIMVDEPRPMETAEQDGWIVVSSGRNRGKRQ